MALILDDLEVQFGQTSKAADNVKQVAVVLRFEIRNGDERSESPLAMHKDRLAFLVDDFSTVPIQRVETQEVRPVDMSPSPLSVAPNIQDLEVFADSLTEIGLEHCGGRDGLNGLQGEG